MYIINVLAVNRGEILHIYIARIVVRMKTYSFPGGLRKYNNPIPKYVHTIP